ncbi:hypothetical protein [Herbaspirillum sp. RV1423]|uniref:hypothetical protein n=1 Tax=Herbaspirillum sp. RV1423 TaxID=1443993 RepID=UPI0004B80FB7|nr:hypothetical protein [Herbaspirillum sp. RV1423]
MTAGVVELQPSPGSTTNNKDKTVKKIAITAALCAASLLAGCASTGNQALANVDQTSVDQHLIKGKSTKADVLAYLGAANSVTTNNSTPAGETWMYMYASSQAKGATFIPVVGLFAGGATGNSKVLMVFFDAQGIVSRYTFSSSNNDTRLGPPAANTVSTSN